MLEKFIEEWFPKTIEWDNVGKFILESGIQMTEEQNPKWLTGYTNIGKSYKPHHEDDYTRYMEEGMFMLHDIIHQIFTLEVNCSEEEYVKRQIYGELFTFYLTEYEIPSSYGMWDRRRVYAENERDCYNLLSWVASEKPRFDCNIIDWMWKVFTEDVDLKYIDRLEKKHLDKYRKMFKEDLENSRKNYKFVPKDIKSYCMVGASSQNHIDFFSTVSFGAIKNIKREFNLELPKEWI